MLLVGFLLSSIVLWLQATHLPALPLLPFAPFLSLACLTLPPRSALLWGAAAGGVADLLGDGPFGLQALAALLALWSSSRIRRLVSADAPLPFALFTGWISAALTLSQASLFFLFDRSIPFSGRWWITEAVCLPLFDALYGALWWTVPFLLWKTARQWSLFWFTNKNRSAP